MGLVALVAARTSGWGARPVISKAVGSLASHRARLWKEQVLQHTSEQTKAEWRHTGAEESPGERRAVSAISVLATPRRDTRCREDTLSMQFSS